MPHGGQQLLGALDGRDTNRGGIDVVGRLAHVHVAVGVNPGVLALAEPEELERTVGDDLVGVHVRRGAGAALDDVDDELVQQAALFDVLAGLPDGVLLHRVDQAQIEVGQYCGVFDLRECRDEQWIRGDLRAGDREVLHRAQCLDSPVGGGRDFRVPMKSVSILPFIASSRTCCHLSMTLGSREGGSGEWEGCCRWLRGSVRRPAAGATRHAPGLRIHKIQEAVTNRSVLSTRSPVVRRGRTAANCRRRVGRDHLDSPRCPRSCAG